MANAPDDPLTLVMIHERQYQEYSVDNLIYCVPVDEREELRLAEQHKILYQLCGERYFFSNIGNPQRILECGYGRGDWVVDVADAYEQCEVTGIDIYPVSLPDQPDNLTLHGYNLNDRLDDPEVFKLNAYDLIHSSFVAQGIKRSRWPSYVRDMKRLLKSNGWVEMAEYYLNIQSDNGRLTEESALRRWWAHYVDGMERSNRNPRIAQRLRHLLTDAGYRHVNETTLRLPIGGWDANPVIARVGQQSVEMVSELLESASLWLFTARLGWTAAQVEVLLNEARRELQDTSRRLYVTIYVARGRRT